MCVWFFLFEVCVVVRFSSSLVCVVIIIHLLWCVGVLPLPLPLPLLLLLLWGACVLLLFLFFGLCVVVVLLLI